MIDVEARLSRIERRVDAVELKTSDLQRQVTENHEWLVRVEKEAATAKAGLDDMRREMSRAEPRRVAGLLVVVFVIWWMLT